MKKKTTAGILILLFGLLLVFTFLGCETPTTPATSGDGTSDSMDDSSDDTGGGSGNGNGGSSKYTVYFIPGIGSGSAPSSQTVSSGEYITLPGQGNMIAPSGYVFSGWESSINGTVYQAGVRYSVTSNIVFTAQWSAGSSSSYTVTFSTGIGSGSAPSSHTASYSGEIITIPGQGSMIAPLGYVFSGWKSSVSGTIYQAGAWYSVTGNVTFTAQWTYSGSGSSGGTGSSLANAININGLTVGTLTSPSQAIWYKFTRIGSASIRVLDRYYNSSYTGDVKISLYGPSGGLLVWAGTDEYLANEEDVGNGTTTKDISAVWNGTIYVKVMPYSASSSFIGSFSIQLIY